MPVLSDFCKISLGFKSLMNDFFYVDETTVSRFGIESEFLLPVFKLADLDETQIDQTLTPTRWLFNCKKQPGDLHGTGAHDYIDWGANQETRQAKKQQKDVVTWKTALERQGQKHWWWPAQPPTRTSLAVRKGYGSRYAPFRFATPCLLDQRLYRIEPLAGVDPDVLTAFFSSSLFGLAMETNADLGLGAGVLTVGTWNLQALPCVDLRALSGSPSLSTVKKALALTVSKKVATVEQYPRAAHIKALDAAILKALKFKAADATEVAQEVARLASERIDRSSLRKVTRREASRADVKAVSSPIVNRLRRWWSARPFPDDFRPPGPTSAYSFAPTELVFEVTYVLGNADVRVTASGVPILDQTVDLYVAELLLRTLQLGRRRFDLPEDPAAAAECLTKLDALLIEFVETLEAELVASSLGTRYDDVVRSAVLGELNIQLTELRKELNTSSTWIIAPVT